VPATRRRTCSVHTVEISGFYFDDEFSKELVKNNAFVFFCSDSIEIADFESEFY